MNQFDIIAREIDNGNITSWAKMMLYAELNGVDTKENILIEMFKYVGNCKFYNLLKITLLSTNFADEYINDDLITTILKCDRRLIVNSGKFYIKPTYMNSIEWLCSLEKRLPIIVLKYILKYESEERDNILTKIGDKPVNSFVSALYVIRNRYIERYKSSKIEKFNEISKRIENIALRINNDLHYMS